MTFRIAHVSDLHVLSHTGDINDDGTIKTIRAHVLHTLGSTFHDAAIAERTECT